MSPGVGVLHAHVSSAFDRLLPSLAAEALPQQGARPAHAAAVLATCAGVSVVSRFIPVQVGVPHTLALGSRLWGPALVPFWARWAASADVAVAVPSHGRG